MYPLGRSHEKNANSDVTETYQDVKIPHEKGRVNTLRTTYTPPLSVDGVWG